MSYSEVTLYEVITVAKCHENAIRIHSHMDRSCVHTHQGLPSYNGLQWVLRVKPDCLVPLLVGQC